MTDSHFERARMIHDAWRKAQRTQIPSLAMVEAACLAGDLDVGEFEELVGAALERRPVELPVSMEKLLDMRVSDAATRRAVSRMKYQLR